MSKTFHLWLNPQMSYCRKYSSKHAYMRDGARGTDQIQYQQGSFMTQKRYSWKAAKYISVSGGCSFIVTEPSWEQMEFCTFPERAQHLSALANIIVGEVQSQRLCFLLTVKQAGKQRRKNASHSTEVSGFCLFLHFMSLQFSLAEKEEPVIELAVSAFTHGYGAHPSPVGEDAAFVVPWDSAVCSHSVPSCLSVEQ